MKRARMTQEPRRGKTVQNRNLRLSDQRATSLESRISESPISTDMLGASDNKKSRRAETIDRRLDAAFFSRDTRVVARELLGTRLVHRPPNGKAFSARIVETEAYHGFYDKASHARNGPTPRTAVMFGPPGHAYVYLCYGIHHLLNFVTGEEGFPAAVLIRGVDQPEGFDEYAIGPGRLSRAMRISRKAHDGIDITRKSGTLWVEKGASPVEPIETSARVGVAYAGEWANKPWRFFLSGTITQSRVSRTSTRKRQ